MTEVLLSRALAQQPSQQDGSLADVVELLADRPLFPEDTSRTLYESLRQMMEHPRTRLFFNPGSQTQSSARLLVITLPGMSLPKQETERSSWSVDERLSVAVLNLAAQFASSRIYSGGMNERKFVGLDEARCLSEWASGRNLFARLERDSRKWNARIVTSSQDRHTALSAQSASKALISDAFIGAAVPFGRWPVSKIEHADVADWVADLSKMKGPDTVRQAHRVLVQVLDHRLPARSPCPGADRDVMRAASPVRRRSAAAALRRP